MAAAKPPFLKYALTLRTVLAATWGKLAKEAKADLLSAADKLDTKKMRSVLTEIDSLGGTFLEKLGTRHGEILASAHKSSTSYWSAHAASEAGKSQSAIVRAQRKDAQTMADLAEAQIAAFLSKFPKRIIHPGILAEIDLMAANPSIATSDILLLKARLERLVTADAYFDGLSQVQVARLWQANGIQMANADGVKRLQIVEMIGDKRTCPVCIKAHGMEIDCSRAAKTVEKGMSITDPDEYNAFWPFPRYPEVEQWSPADWLRDGRFPPFHNRCRGQVRFLY